jgi:hypothetical protein
MSIIVTLKSEIKDLEKAAEDLDKQRASIGEQLLRKRKLLTAFDLVSTEPELYDKWIQTVQETPRPEAVPDSATLNEVTENPTE